MPKFRKKPITIEAIQWDGNNTMEVGMFMTPVQPVYMDGFSNADELVGIETLEGLMVAKIGDWIIKEPFATDNRKFYPCKPEIFSETYEPIETPIEKEEVVFDRFGQWSHSAIHALDEKYDEVPFREIPAFQDLELLPIRVFDDDKIALLEGPDLDQPADFRKWQPDPPSGDGWFPFTFSDDQDGPYVIYARYRQPVF